MAAIKSVKTASGKRVQVGSKAYSKAMAGGDSPVSGTGKNLTSRDIKNVGGGYTDKPSTVRDKQAAQAMGELLPYQEAEQAITPPQVPTEAPVNAPVVPPTAPNNAVVKPPSGTPQAPATPQAEMAQRYQTGFQQAQTAGLPVPTTSAGGSLAVQKFVPPAQEDTSVIDAQLAEDKGWQEIQQMKKDYFDPKEQKTSLMDTYNKLYKKSGLDDLDEEIIDAKTVIEGTEDDIRNEIQAAGGFGTDSQVQAMALARNKSLLKNYNNLVAMREMKQNHLDTQMQLAEKDRAYADQKFDRMLNFDLQVMNYKTKFVDNTRSQLNTMLSTFGADGLYNMYSQDPRQLAFAEKIMGLGTGGLQKVAQQAVLDRTRSVQKENLQLDLLRSDLATSAMQRSKIQSEINAQSGEGGTKEQQRQTVVNLAKDLLNPDSVGKNSAVGPSLAKAVPFGLKLGLQGNRAAFEAKVESLKANLTLDNLKLLKGAMSDKDLAFLQAVGSSLNTKMSVKNFDDELTKIIGRFSDDEVITLKEE